MSESVYLIREQGSGKPRVSRSALIDQNQLLGNKKRAGIIPARLHSATLSRKKGVERPDSLSPTLRL